MDKTTLRIMKFSMAGIACLAAALLFPPAAGAQLVIGGWDSSRGGSYNIVDGSATTGFRSAVADSFPGATIEGTDALTTSYLSTVNVMVLTSVIDGTDATTALTTSEQTALQSFVLSGGKLVLLTDNSTFAGSGTTAINDSYLSPFGFAATGTLSGNQNSTFSNPGGSPVSHGQFGSYSSWTSNYPGWFDQIGTDGQTLSTLDSNGDASLAMIAPGALASGSGSVVLFSDSTPLISAEYTPDMNLVMNSISFLPAPAPPSLLVALIGSGPALMLVRRNRRR
jgi:hypothetical protein